MLDKELEFTLNSAFKDAREKRHEFITVEHLLLALTENPTAVGVLEACGVDLRRLKKDLIKYVENNTPLLTDTEHQDTQPTLGFQRVLQRAVFHVQSSGKKEVSGANVLVALFGEQDSQAVYLLSRQDVTRLDIVNYLAHGAPLKDEDQFGSTESADDSVGKEESKSNLLDQFATNLNQRAREGLIDPLIGRSAEIERTIQILCRRRKNNPLFVGEAGVGKTALAEGLARKIVEGDVPSILQDAKIYALDLGSLVAGTKYRGDFEKRLKGILSQLKKEKNTIVFIDEIHTLIGAGSASGGVMDASNLIKPMLANGELKCMGSTTYQEYRSIFEKDRALTRRFQKIDVLEPSVEETYQILKGLKPRFEEHHNVVYTNPALHAAAQLSDKYITDRYLPDKAIDVIDEAGARRQLLSKSKRSKRISVKDIEVVIAKIARIPSKQMSLSDVSILKNLSTNLKLVVFGQDHAIEELTAAIKMARSGLNNPEKPIGSYLFSGPTGVGKTEVSRQLAYHMGIDLIRFDMSEYMERHSVSRLIGAPPGYVGYDQGGLLTEAISKHPHAVLLLDEIEKAHPDIFNLLLQIMDHGTLTDANGRMVDFRHVVLIMTTNIGAQEVSRRTMGFAEQDHTSDSMEAIKRAFSPEFRNRLDAVIRFNALDERTIRNVVDKFLIELEGQLDEKKVELLVDDQVRQWLAAKGYDPVMGARPMARVIQEYLKKPLAEEVLFGRLQHGGRVYVRIIDDRPLLDFAGEAVT